MKTTWLAVLVCVASVVIDGCKSNKPEPIPGPKVGADVVRHLRPAGIAWFQGSVEEAFSRTEARRPTGRNRAEAPLRQLSQSCPHVVKG